jgi:uncharacterized membrane protein
MSQIAHNFLAHGIWASHAIPIQNNDPAGNEPDAYVRWPPLFPLLLSGLFRLFGESERVGRSFMLLLTLVESLAVGWLARRCAGTRAGLLAVFAYLVTPVVFIYGKLVIMTQLGVFFLTLSAIALLHVSRPGAALSRRWLFVGAACMCLAVLASWEPLTAPFGLVVAAVIVRDRPVLRVAATYAAVALASCAGLLAWYAWNHPHLIEGMKQGLLLRANLAVPAAPAATTPLHALVDESGRRLMTGRQVVGQLLNRISLLDELTVVGFGIVVIGSMRRSTRQLGFLLAFLLAPWVLWSAFMSQQSAVHEYQLLVIVPAVALGFSVGMSKVLDYLDGATLPLGGRLRAVCLTLVPAIMVLPLWHEIHQQSSPLRLPDPTVMPFARALSERTQPGAVILVPMDSPVAVYYSKRHLIRGIHDDEMLDRALPLVPSVFPGVTPFLAFPRDEASKFSKALQRFPVDASGQDLVLLRLTTSNQRWGFPTSPR